MTMKKSVLTFLLFALLKLASGQENAVAVKPGERYAENASMKGRITAIVLTLISGPVAGHRIYLGTHPKVPFIYAITLGGGLGILPIIDLGYILFSRNLEKLLNNQHVFIWLK